jgi:hypothetical protein
LHIKYTLSVLKKFGHYFTGPAYFHFFFPVFLGLALADRAVDQPAEPAGIVFIGRTFLALFGRAFFYDPAGFAQFAFASFSGQQEKHLPFHMGGD